MVNRKRLKEAHEFNRDRKNLYLEYLEKSSTELIPKLTHLYTTAALDHYAIQIRTQSEESFRDTRRICWSGFIVVICGVVIAFFGSICGLKNALDIGTVTVAGGAITEIVAGTVLVVYGRAIDQSELIIKELSQSQKYSFDAAIKNTIPEQNSKCKDN